MTGSTAIVVLSGHRCGSSLVAGVLHELGVFVGDELLGPTLDNALGHHEDLEFQRLHKDIIGHDWRAPVVDFEPYRDAYADLCAKRCAGHALWGVKDPRLAFVFPFFLECLLPGTEVKAVRAYRDPVQAARSMAARSARAPGEGLAVTPERARQIAGVYEDQVQRVLATWPGPHLTVTYDALIDDPVQQVARLAAFVGVEPNDQAVAFVRPELRHWT